MSTTTFPPTLTAISPISGTAGTLVDVVLTGSGFAARQTTVQVGDGGVSATGVNIKSGTTLTATFAVAAGATVGAHHVTVTTPGGTTEAEVFAVTAPKPATAPSVTPPRAGILEGLPPTIALGAGVTLHWTSSVNATACEIDHGVGVVECDGGNRGVSPRIDTVYTFTAVGPGGADKSSARVHVTGQGQTNPAHGTQVFGYTGGTQVFVVPDGVTEIEVEVSGGQGGSGETPDGVEDGGKGGEIDATIPVTPGEELVIVVGGEGQSPTHDNEAGKGGFNGGGDAPPAEHAGGGGGGESDIRQGGSSPENIVIEAGGGGGGGGGGQASGNGGSGGNGGGAKPDDKNNNGIGHGVTDGGAPGTGPSGAPGQIVGGGGNGGQSAAGDKVHDIKDKPESHAGNGNVVIKW